VRTKGERTLKGKEKKKKSKKKGEKKGNNTK